jgi:long-chain acyl-CoA synthetase
VTAIYTSGTTGIPKAVVLTHANVAWTGASVMRRLAVDHAGWRWVNYLPMAHVATRFVGHYFHCAAGTVVVPCRNPADVEDVVAEVHPHFIFAPPRIWERVRTRVWAAIRTDPRREWAARAEASLAAGVACGVELVSASSRPSDHPWWPGPEVLELRRGVGLDECRWASAGGAPATPELLAFVYALGVPVCDNYGLSESTGIVTFDPTRFKFGRVGRPLPGVDVTIAADGEIGFRGGNAFAGYLDDPVETERAIDADGWVWTGDLGRLDDEGYLELGGRKKELIRTAGAENVAPAAVEAALETIPVVAQACVVGEGRSHLAALIHLDPVAAADWLAAQGRSGSDLAGPVDDRELHAHIAAAVQELNARLHRPERVRAFAVLAGAWEIDSDELTPTAKLRRGVIAEKYAAEIESLYAPGSPAVTAVPA